MSIFISDVPFDLILNIRATYETQGDVDVLLAVEILPDNVELTDDIFVLKCKCLGRDAETMSSIMEKSTIINHVTGEPLVRVSVLYKSILSSFFVEWNLNNQDGAPMPLNNQSVGKLHDSILKSLARKWLRMTGSTKNV